ncbi:hypothetical protein ACJX0J_027006, partial [Zea mays]
MKNFLFTGREYPDDMGFFLSKVKIEYRIWSKWLFGLFCQKSLLFSLCDKEYQFSTTSLTCGTSSKACGNKREQNFPMRPTFINIYMALKRTCGTSFVVKNLWQQERTKFPMRTYQLHGLSIKC